MTPDEIVQRALAHLGGDADAWNAGMKLEPGSSGALVFRADPPEHLTAAVHAMDDCIAQMQRDELAALRAENERLKAESRAHVEHIAGLQAQLSALAKDSDALRLECGFPLRRQHQRIGRPLP